MNVRPRAALLALCCSLLVCLASPAMVEGSEAGDGSPSPFRPVEEGVSGDGPISALDDGAALARREQLDAHSLSAPVAVTDSPEAARNGAAPGESGSGVRGVGFLAHVDFGVGFSSHPVVAGPLYSTTDKAIDDGDLTARTMNTVGLSSRVELWPIHSRRAGIGAFGAGYVGGMPDGSTSAGSATGGVGIQGFAGSDRVRALAMLGSDVRLGAQGGGVIVQASPDGDVTGDVSGTTFRYVAHRAGLGVRFGFDRGDRSGLDLWVIADRPYYATGKSGRGPVVGFPSFADSAVVLRGSFWMRSALQLALEVAPSYPAPPLASGGIDFGSTGAWAVATLGFGLERRSRPYGGDL